LTLVAHRSKAQIKSYRSIHMYRNCFDFLRVFSTVENRSLVGPIFMFTKMLQANCWAKIHFLLDFNPSVCLLSSVKVPDLIEFFNFFPAADFGGFGVD